MKHSKAGLQTSSHPQNSASHLLGLQGMQLVEILSKYFLKPFLIILNHSEMQSVPKMDENIKFKARVNQFSKSWLCQKTIQFCARIQFTAMKLNNYCSVTFSLYLQLTTQYLSRVVGRSENLRGGIGKGE